MNIARYASIATRSRHATAAAGLLLSACLPAQRAHIGARGFDTNIANKRLVPLEGRTAHWPLLSRVFCGAQDLSLEAVEPIERIDGTARRSGAMRARAGSCRLITFAAGARPCCYRRRTWPCDTSRTCHDLGHPRTRCWTYALGWRERWASAWVLEDLLYFGQVALGAPGERSKFESRAS